MPLIFAVIVCVSFVWYFLLSRQIWDVVDTPTVSPSGAIIGLCEVQGKAAAAFVPSGEEIPLYTSPVSGYPCVWFELHVEAYVKSGKSSTWQTFRKRSADGGFRIADQYGSIAVNPRGSESYLTKPIEQSTSENAIRSAYDFFCEYPSRREQELIDQWSASPDGYYMWHPLLGQWVPSRYVSPDRKYYFDWKKVTWVSITKPTFLESAIAVFSWGSEDRWSQGKLRVTETVVLPGSDIFAHGYVSLTPDGTDIAIGNRKGSRLGFFLSTGDENKLLKKLRIKKWIVLTVAVVLGFILEFIALSEISDDTSGFESVNGSLLTSIVLRAIIFSVVLMIGALLLKILRTFNRFIRLREQVRLSRSAIDITLKRRAALIPEICDVISEVTKHEKTVLELVTKLRNAQAETASHEILALAEAYPVINSSENFLHLQNELGRTEEKIAMARSFLNDSILAMDNLRATLTGMVFSPLFAKEQRPSE